MLASRYCKMPELAIPPVEVAYRSNQFLQRFHSRQAPWIYAIALDVGFPSDSNVAVTKNRLDDDIGYAKLVQVRSKAAAKCVPTMSCDFFP